MGELAPTTPRRALACRVIRFTSPEKADYRARRLAKGRRGGRPPAFDPEPYDAHNVVERCSTGSSSSATSPPATAKRAAYWRSELLIAATILWLREPLQDTALGRNSAVSAGGD